MSERSAQLALRLVLLATCVVIVQTAAVSQFTILGVRADLSPLLVVAAGFLLGSIPGALLGFYVGLFVDTALLQTLGVSSLLYVLIGYGAGRWRELRDPASSLAPVAVGAAGTAAALIGFSAMQFMLGVDSPVSLLLIREIVVTVIVNAALAVPVFALVRRVVLPYLPEDPRRRRRRAYTTGGLSPISRA